jgi:hypothetical protein
MRKFTQDLKHHYLQINKSINVYSTPCHIHLHHIKVECYMIMRYIGFETAILYTYITCILEINDASAISALLT